MLRREQGPSRYHSVIASEISHKTTKVKRLAFELRNPVSLNDLGDLYHIHTTSAGEQLEDVAFRVAGDTRYWWVIADLNLAVLEDTVNIPAGTQLIVPDPSFFTSAAMTSKALTTAS